MELVKEHTALIEKLVKLNPKYSGNEDLTEDFCSETYKKSYLILQSVSDKKALESYLKKVVSSAIMDVLKNNGRIVRTTKGYNSVKEISINQDNITAPTITEDTTNSKTEPVELKDTASIKKYETPTISSSVNTNLLNIKDPKENIEEQIIRKDIIENIINMVKQINIEKPQEMYLKIFYMRYFLQKKQREISQETGISQSEVSKRLVSLSQLIKEKLY